MSEATIHFDLRLIALVQMFMIALKVTLFPDMILSVMLMPLWVPLLIVLIFPILVKVR